MARRTLKPFTVEVRKGGRKVKAAAAPWPADPMLTTAHEDQPRVSWPEFEDAPEQPVDAEEPVAAPPPATGRVLPAQDGKPTAAPEAPRRAGRQRKARTELSGLAHDAESIIQAPDTAHGATMVASVGPENMAEPLIPALDAAEPVSAAAIDPKAENVASDKPPRPNERLRRSRRLRETFPMGERWKARLPAAVFTRRR